MDKSVKNVILKVLVCRQQDYFSFFHLNYWSVNQFTKDYKRQKRSISQDSPPLSSLFLNEASLTKSLLRSPIAVGCPVTHKPTKCRLSCLQETNGYFLYVQNFFLILTCYCHSEHLSRTKYIQFLIYLDVFLKQKTTYHSHIFISVLNQPVTYEKTFFYTVTSNYIY